MEKSQLNEWFMINANLLITDKHIYYDPEDIMFGRFYDMAFQNEKDLKLLWFQGINAVGLCEWIDRDKIVSFNEFFEDFNSLSDEYISLKQLHFIMYKYITYLHKNKRITDEAYNNYKKK